jgi:hypothetical protein
MPDELTPAPLTFKDVPIDPVTGRFHFEGRHYTKVSYNKARCDERRDGDAPRRFRDSDLVQPERTSHPAARREPLENASLETGKSGPTKPPVKPPTKPQAKPEIKPETKPASAAEVAPSEPPKV